MRHLFKKITRLTLGIVGLVFSAHGYADTNVICSLPLFVGGPLKASIRLQDSKTNFRLECPAGSGKNKFPHFGELDSALRAFGLLDVNEFIESLTISDLVGSNCSHASSVPTLIGCSNNTAFPLHVVVANKTQNVSRQFDLQTLGVGFNTARKIFETASGQITHQDMSYEVRIRLEIKVSEDKIIYPVITETFYGENGCIN